MLREIIKTLRKRGYTQEETAKVVGIHQTAVSKTENTSIMKNHNTCIFDQRYTLNEEQKEEKKNENSNLCKGFKKRQ